MISLEGANPHPQPSHIRMRVDTVAFRTFGPIIEPLGDSATERPFPKIAQSTPPAIRSKSLVCERAKSGLLRAVGDQKRLLGAFVDLEKRMSFAQKSDDALHHGRRESDFGGFGTKPHTREGFEPSNRV
mgnify:CR=1 FL=1